MATGEHAASTRTVMAETRSRLVCGPMAYLMISEPVSIRQQAALGIAIGVVAALLVFVLSVVRGADTTSFATTDSGVSGYTGSFVVAEIAPSGETEIYINGEYAVDAVTEFNGDGELDVFLADGYVASVPAPS